MKKISLIVLVLVVVGVVYAASGLFVQKVEQCDEQIVTYQEEEPVYELVTRERPTYTEEEVYYAENDSYGTVWVQNGTEEYQEQVQTGTKTVTKQRAVCPDTSYLEVGDDTNKVVLEYIGNHFECKPNGDIIECDSRWDGNGDGRCQSGESCYFVEKEDGCIKVTQKNSNAGYKYETKTINGVCFKIQRDTSFKKKWDLVTGGGGQ